ncbi:MAG TPA: hypothetical protein VG454_09500, partial [Gemmatimonadales bacterium]|nr:hypothetical protein [Gemmatimonadales bacterium]
MTIAALPRQLDVSGGMNHHANVDRLYADVDPNWVFLSTLEWEAVPNPGDAPTIQFAGGFYRVPKSGGSPELVSTPSELVVSDPFATDEHSMYFLSAVDATGITISSVPKSGGAATKTRLDASDGNLGAIDSIGMDPNYFYISRSPSLGPAHNFCVSRAPVSGGPLEDLWCPDFLVQRLTLAGGLLVGINGYPWTGTPG